MAAYASDSPITQIPSCVFPDSGMQHVHRKLLSSLAPLLTLLPWLRKRCRSTYIAAIWQRKVASCNLYHNYSEMCWDATLWWAAGLVYICVNVTERIFMMYYLPIVLPSIYVYVCIVLLSLLVGYNISYF